jgi:hypothetical protein
MFPQWEEGVVRSAGVLEGTRHCMKKNEKAKQQQGNESPCLCNTFFLPRDYTVTTKPKPKP